jgi:NADPH-dependent glutamate synthase beta subunit-like oxidoreductase
MRLLGSNGKLTTIRCQRMQREDAGATDSAPRGRMVPVPGSDFDVKADNVLVAIGEAPDPSFLPEGTSVELAAWGGLLVNPETLATAAPGVFAAGDITYGPKTVIHAAAHGRKAARAIHAFLQHLSPQAVAEMPEDEFETVSELPADGHITLDLHPTPREAMPLLSGAAARERAVEYAAGFTEEAARREASRCLRCDLAYLCPSVKLVGHEGRIASPTRSR